MKFVVLRRHRGDRDYRPGDEREASESDVAHLVRAGVLRRKEEPKKAQAKAEEAPQNKAEAAPVNKSRGKKKAG